MKQTKVNNIIISHPKNRQACKLTVYQYGSECNANLSEDDCCKIADVLLEAATEISKIPTKKEKKKNE